MDRKITKKKWTSKRIGIIIGAIVLSALSLYGVLASRGGSKLNIEEDKISISTVKLDGFQEYIPATGEVMPGTTRYIDAVQSGFIKDIHKESGEMLKKGDIILELSNSDLELTVMQRESALYEQLSILRNSRLSLEQNTLNLKNRLAEIDYQLYVNKPKYERALQLYNEKMISKEEFEEAKGIYDFNVKSKKLFMATLKNDSLSRRIQLLQMKESERSMLKSLSAVGKILDNLIVTAPIDGQLSMAQLEIGQSIASRERLGQMDLLDDFQVKVSLDESYLTRIEKGQKGTLIFDGKSYELAIFKIYPTVNNGLFEVAMKFKGATPNEIKRGQSFRIRLELGSSSKALVVPSGEFYNTTGGNWIFVVKDGRATKRKVKFGRKNLAYYEVIDGLQEGDRVVTSSYRDFGEKEVLVLK